MRCGLLMGNPAVRFEDRLVLWDGEAMKVINADETNAYVGCQGMGLE